MEDQNTSPDNFHHGNNDDVNSSVNLRLFSQRDIAHNSSAEFNINEHDCMWKQKYMLLEAKSKQNRGIISDLERERKRNLDSTFELFKLRAQIQLQDDKIQELQNIIQQQAQLQQFQVNAIHMSAQQQQNAGTLNNNNNANNNMSNFYAQQLQNTLMSQSYLSVPQEHRKSHMIQPVKDGIIYFQHNSNNNHPGSGRSSHVPLNNQNLQINGGQASPMPINQRVLRVSDLSNLSGANQYNNQNFRLTPDTQENSQIFYQSTYGGNDIIQPLTPHHNMLMNRQLNIDDDELIEIRPDMMNTMMGSHEDQQLMMGGFFRDNSRDSTGSFYVDHNFMDNQSLENVKDTTVNNSPNHNIKRVNGDGMPQSAKTSGKKEIYIEEPQLLTQNDNLPHFGAQLDVTQNQLQNETGILRYSLANQTVFLQRQRKPFEEIMKRRKLKEIIVQNNYELQFSQMQGLELVPQSDNNDQQQKEERQFVDKQDYDSDALYQMQNDIFEEIMMRKEPVYAVTVSQNNYPKNQQHQKKQSLKNTTPQRKSKIEPIIEKIVQDDRDDQIYMHSEQADSDNVTPINRQNHLKQHSQGTDFTDKSVTMYDARLSGSGIMSDTQQYNTYRNPYEDDSQQMMKPIIEEDEEDNLLSSQTIQTNGSQQNIKIKGSSYHSNRQQNKPVMFDRHHGEDSFEEVSQNDDESIIDIEQVQDQNQYSEEEDDEEDDYRTEETQGNDGDVTACKANQTAVLTKKSTIPKSNTSRSNPHTEESPNIHHTEDNERKPKTYDYDNIIVVSRSQSKLNQDLDNQEEMPQFQLLHQNNSLLDYEHNNQNNFTVENDNIASNSMVMLFNSNLKSNEVRVSRTKTVQLYRDSNLQDTSRGLREPAKYNPDYTLMQMEELNKSVVFKLRPSNYIKKHKPTVISKDIPKAPILIEDLGENEEVEDDENKLNVYLSKPVAALQSKEFVSPVIQRVTKFEEDPIPKQKQDSAGSRNQKQDVIVAKSMTLTQSFTDLFHSTANLLNPNRKRSSLGDIQENYISLYHLLKLNFQKAHQKLKSQHFYEEFLMIGADQESLMNTAENNIGRLVPKTLYKFPLQTQNEHMILCERSKVVKDFCFPNGVLAVKLNFKGDDEFSNDPEVNDIIQDYLYRQKNYRESSFIFTLDANEEVGESGDNYMHCLCVTFNELMRRQSDGQLFLVQKGYCFMFQNSYFPLHLEVLNGLLECIKQERFKQHEDFYESGHQQILRLVESALSVPLITSEIENVLGQYYNLVDQSEDLPTDLTICMQIQNNLGEIRYTFPKTYDDCKRLDCMWFCPTIFSLFHIQDFYKILTAVLLERSLIFVSDNLAILTSVVLGFKSLIRPFQWCYALIPVLPSPLLDILDMPQPILCGITRHDYQNINLSEDEMQMKTWIFLDEEQIQVNWGQFDSDLSEKTKKQQNLMKWCRTLIKDTEEFFAKFQTSPYDSQKKSILQGRISDSAGKPSIVTRQTITPIEDFNNSVVLVPNDLQKTACRNIFSKIQESIDNKILMNIPGTPIYKTKSFQQNLEININEMANLAVSKAKGKDEVDFLKEFIKTQMFTTLVEDFFNKSPNILESTTQSLQNIISPK